MTEKLAAWQREGAPFHLWLTLPACEDLNVTFAMNVGWASTRGECARLLIYKSAHEPQSNPLYHPTLVGEDFIRRGGALVDIGVTSAPDPLEGD